MTLLAAAPRPHHVALGAVPRPSLAQEVLSASRRLRLLAAAIPGSTPLHAVEGEPHPDLLAKLVSVGGTFSVETPAKLHACLAAGARRESLVLGHVVTPDGAPDRSSVFADCVEVAARAGVRRFVVGSADGCRAVADVAPGSSVLCRVAGRGTGPAAPSPTGAEAFSVLLLAARLGLDPAGVAVHVVDQRQGVGTWRAAITGVSSIYSALRRAGHSPWLLGLGGVPTDVESGAAQLVASGAAIDRALRQQFGARRPHTLVELGAPLA